MNGKFYPRPRKRVATPQDRAHFERRALIAKAARRMKEERDTSKDDEREENIPGVDQELEYRGGEHD